MIGILAILLAQPAAPTGQAAPAEQEYFQQGVHYTIEARLNEEAETLTGAATLRYTNNSPETLHELFLHLHLNAFRPDSRWAGAEQREQFDFQSLEEPDFGYERLSSARIGDSDLEVSYPHEPDSTVVRLALPQSLEPGGSLTVRLDWEARPSTLCRRQCRRGRSFDFAQWYPRIAPFDAWGWQAHPLYPQGEFYGEFATYDVTLDLASDQVVGATGVPLQGNPGWAPGDGSPIQEAPLQRDWYAYPVLHGSPGLLPDAVPAGRKRVRFYAEDVHHFAWTTSPDYRYEAAMHGDVAIHVLYRPGDFDWDLGAAANRTVRSLRWLESVFGPYPYPQLTNVHRLEGGGTEFPMVIMDGSASQGLITHETAHQYAHGILANNEWRDAWLDEGMASFLTNWFMEEHGIENVWTRAVDGVGQAEALGQKLPVATVSEDFPDFRTYGLNAYTKPSVVYYMLREHLGADVFRQGLQAYFAAKKLQHVSEADLIGAMESASGEDLGWFFDQWIHQTGALDYSFGEVEVEQLEDGSWRTRAEVEWSGAAWMPVVVQAGDQRQTLAGRDSVQAVEFMTRERPQALELDPERLLIDTDRSNNIWPEESAASGAPDTP